MCPGDSGRRAGQCRDACRLQRAVLSCISCFPDTCCLPALFAQVDEGTLGEAGKNWPRPPPPQLNPASTSLGEYYRIDAKWCVFVLFCETAVCVLCVHPCWPPCPWNWLVAGVQTVQAPSPSASLPAVFQQLEVDYAMQGPHPVYHPTDLKEVPVVRAACRLCPGLTCCLPTTRIVPACRQPASSGQMSRVASRWLALCVHLPPGAHVRRDRRRLLRSRLCARL